MGFVLETWPESEVSGADEMQRAKQVVDEMVHLAHGLGGTCTGEHGVGHGKLSHMHAEHGVEALEVRCCVASRHAHSLDL